MKWKEVMLSEGRVEEIALEKCFISSISPLVCRADITAYLHNLNVPTM